MHGRNRPPRKHLRVYGGQQANQSAWNASIAKVRPELGEPNAGGPRHEHDDDQKDAWDLGKQRRDSEVELVRGETSGKERPPNRKKQVGNAKLATPVVSREARHFKGAEIAKELREL